jgi:hypothetical protein
MILVDGGNMRRVSLAPAAPSCDDKSVTTSITDPQMTLLKIGVAAAALCLSLLSPSASQARPLGTVDWMPFFGLPYPFGYVYHPPRMECYDIQQVQTPDGPMIQQVWVCDGEPPVRAKY